jgi:hypothetical protein
VVVVGDSMYRGLGGTVVGLDVLRTARLDGFNRRYLKAGVGAVLVEQTHGALFVVPARCLEKV